MISAPKVLPPSSGDSIRFEIDGRFLSQSLTGVQRHATQVSQELMGASCGHQVSLRELRNCPSSLGHLWEQTVLPMSVLGRWPLWSPCNFGPVSVQRQLVTIHDVAHFDHPEWFTPAYALLARSVHRALVRRGARIATVSQFSAERIASRLGIPVEEVTITGNGGDHVSSVNDSALNRLGLRDKRYLLAYGSLEPRKNFGRILQAWAKLEGTLPTDARLVVAGAANHQRVHGGDSEQIESSTTVISTGRLGDDELFGLLNHAQSLVFVPLYEGYGLPLVEAWQLTTPAIASNIPPHREINPPMTTWVDPASTDEIAAAMLERLETPPNNEELSPPAPTWSAVAERTIRALRELA